MTGTCDMGLQWWPYAPLGATRTDDDDDEAVHYTVIKHDEHLRTREKCICFSSVLKCPEY